MPADNQQRSSLHASTLNVMERNKEIHFVQTKVLKTMVRWLPEPHVQVQRFADIYQKKQSASICCQVC